MTFTMPKSLKFAINHVQMIHHSTQKKIQSFWCFCTNNGVLQIRDKQGLMSFKGGCMIFLVKESICCTLLKCILIWYL